MKKPDDEFDPRPTEEEAITSDPLAGEEPEDLDDLILFDDLDLDLDNPSQVCWAFNTSESNSGLFLENMERPGYDLDDNRNVPRETVDAWLVGLRRKGVASIICLLDPDELACYPGLDLPAYYFEQGFNVAHIPVATGQRTALTRRQREEIWRAYRKLCKPVLIHHGGGRRDEASSRILDAALRHIRRQLRRRETDKTDWWGVVRQEYPHELEWLATSLVRRRQIFDGVHWNTMEKIEAMRHNPLDAVQEARLRKIEENLERGRAEYDYATHLKHMKDGGMTPLHWAARHGRLELAKMLLARGIDVNAQDKSWKTPLHTAFEYSAYEVYGDDDRMEMMRLLLAHGADPEIMDAHGRTAFHNAICQAETILGLKRLAILELIMALPGNVNTWRTDVDLAISDPLEKHRSTPLHDAVDKGLTHVVKLLLERGANPHSRTIYGHTPLHLAACHKNQELIVDLLLVYGADLNAEDDTGLTPILLAMEHRCGEMVRHLLSRDARLEFKLTGDARKDCHACMPMEFAIREGYLDLMECFWRYGASLENDSPNWNPLLHDAIAGGKAEIVSWLLEHGVSPNPTECYGRLGRSEDSDSDACIIFDMADDTPLHEAVRAGQPELVRMLLEAGADSGIRNRDQETPLELAEKEQKLEIVQLLITAK